MAKIKIQDDSGDRKYFTILPNYIANHSTANDQALYFQMKRYAGEDGECFATEETLCKKLGIGRKALWKARDYLIEHKWITFLGMTGGKTRPIKTYKVNDIWKMNNEHYEKISAERDISLEDKSQKEHKITLKRDIEEEPIKEEPFNTTEHSSEEINLLIKEFEKVNPASRQFYARPPQRKAAKFLIDTYGFERVRKVIELTLPRTNGLQYFPTIITPIQLQDKWVTLESAIRKYQSEKLSKGKEIIV